VTAITDPLSHQTTFTYNNAGQPLTVTDALNKTTTFGYAYGNLTSITSPLGNVETRFVDSGGRLLRVTDPGGAMTPVRVQRLQPGHEDCRSDQRRDHVHIRREWQPPHADGSKTLVLSMPSVQGITMRRCNASLVKTQLDSQAVPMCTHMCRTAPQCFEILWVCRTFSLA
jgi:YD repeat-containing protein